MRKHLCCIIGSAQSMRAKRKTTETLKTKKMGVLRVCELNQI